MTNKLSQPPFKPSLAIAGQRQDRKLLRHTSGRPNAGRCRPGACPNLN
jgi:hypothetical protein